MGTINEIPQIDIMSDFYRKITEEKKACFRFFLMENGIYHDDELSGLVIEKRYGNETWLWNGKKIIGFKFIFDFPDFSNDNHKLKATYEIIKYI